MNTHAEHSRCIPVQRSILSAEALAPIVAQTYGLDRVRCQLIKSAMLDTYQILAATGPAILRIYPAQRRTETAILAELDVLARLHAAGLAVSTPILQLNGEQLLAVQAPEGVRYAALFTFAPGQPLSQQCTPPNARLFGHTLAQLHAIADTLAHPLARPPLDLSTLLDRSITALDHVFGQRTADWVWLQQVATTVRSHIAALPTEPPWYGLCHGDAGSANAHVSADGCLTLFDFDMCGVGWRAYDIAAMMARHGYGVLLLDVRGHGNSGGQFTLGWDANLDIDAAIAYLRARPDVDPDRIGALGLSMGGEVAMQAAAHTERLKVVVSDGAGARSLGDSLSGPVNPLAVPAMWTSTYALALFTGLRPPPPLTELIPRITPRPLLIISAGHGMGGEIELSDLFYAAAGEPKQRWQIPEAGHTGGLAARPQEYETQVIAFFDAAFVAPAGNR